MNRILSTPTRTAALARLAGSLVILAGLWLAFLTPKTTLLAFRPADFSAQQTRLGQGIRALSPENRRQAALPLPAFIAEKTAPCLLRDSLPQDTMDGILEASRGSGAASWAWRTSPEDYEQNRLAVYFRADDPALGSLTTETSCFATDGKTFLEITPVTLDAQDFTLGAGFSGPDLPTRLFHPFRMEALLLMAAGLLLQILLGYPGYPADAAHYHRTRIVLSDVVAAIMLYGFFILPLLIAGSSRFVLDTALPATIALWTLAGFGAFIAIHATQAACFSIQPAPNGLLFSHVAGSVNIPFTEIAWYAPASKTSPKWLVTLLVLAGMIGRGNAGQAILLSRARTEGMALHLKNGNTLFIWTTDQMGTPALAGWPEVAAHIVDGGVAAHKTEIHRTGLGSDVLVDAKGRNVLDRKIALAGSLGLAATLALLLLATG